MPLVRTPELKFVSVLVITRNRQEIKDICTALEAKLVKDKNEPLALEHLQQLCELDEDGKSLIHEWDKVIAAATKRVKDTEGGTSCYVTVTDFFGGRGHDYNVMDQITNENGGMLVIATSVPDTREWIQWKGRTARQDRPGKFAVLLSKEDKPFTVKEKLNEDVVRSFKSFGVDDGDKKINYLLEKADSHIRETLTLREYSSDQAMGAWLNELSQKYYKKHPRGHSEPWPSTDHFDNDQKLRHALSRFWLTGLQIKEHAKATFDIDLTGPPREWDYPEDKEFVLSPEAKKAAMAGGGPKSFMMVLDVSGSMAGSRLDTCKVSISTIIQRLEKDDRVGLVTFADDIRVDVPLQLKDNNESTLCSQVAGLRTRGTTAFYAGVLEGAQLLSGGDSGDRQKWLVALTDGGDNCGPRSAIEDAAQIIERTPNMNFALITVGNLTDPAFTRYKEAAEKNGSKGMIVPASDQASIMKAFENVEEAMATAGAM